MDYLDLAYVLLEANVDVQVPIAARGGPISLRRVPQPVLDLQDLDDPRIGELLERCARGFQRRQRLRDDEAAAQVLDERRVAVVSVCKSSSGPGAIVASMA